MGIFTAAGKRHFDEVLKHYWASAAAIDRWGICHWESERFPNDWRGAVSTPPMPEGGPYWRVSRLWEDDESDELLIELQTSVMLEAGEDALLRVSVGLWVTFGAPLPSLPLPPPPAPTASGSG